MPGYEPDRPDNPILRWSSYLRDGILQKRIGMRVDYIVGDIRRARWKAMQKKREFKDIRLARGVRMRLFLDSEVSYAIYAKDFEALERKFHLAFLRTGDIYIDIGANIGLFTLLAAKQVGKEGRVYAFEPTPTTYERLLTNVRLNQFENVSTYQCAVSDKSGQAAMTLSLDGFDGRNSIATPTGGEQFSTALVKTTTLDEFVAEQNLSGKISMIKIDVEGWETYVLAGGRKCLSASTAPILQVEFAEEARESAGSSSMELHRSLTELGYQLFTFDGQDNNLTPVTLERIKNCQFNVIATKNYDEVISRIRRES
jgi:FkbM family methyltransferase